MGDSRLNNFEVKSKIHNYKVNFVDDYFDTLKDIVSDGDVIIIDEKIVKLYPKINDISCVKIMLEANEKTKSFNGVGDVIKILLDLNFKKNYKFIAIGGGIIQDITAFISMTMFRGVKWYFFPTTLLAQGDSCIGSKSSINFEDKKNQLGGFYPPNEIFIDINFTKTLTVGDLYSGLGEMLHYFLISGKSDFEYFKDNINNLNNLIKRSLEIKKSMIEIDEFDVGPRLVFNYGHSFGHAIESITNYKVPHGIAVCHGMDIANFLSLQFGYMTELEYLEIHQIILDIIEKNDYNFKLDDIDTLISKMRKDKKNISNTFGLILTKGIGDMFLIQKSELDIKNNLIKYNKNI
jgi:3-dehydroquinate synthase